MAPQGPAKNRVDLRRIMEWAQKQEDCPICDDPECECWESLVYAIEADARKLAQGQLEQEEERP